MITCGPTGSTGQQIADAINLNTSKVDGIIAKPISRIYSTTALASQNLTGTPSNVILGNASQTIKAGIPITSFQSFTSPETGYYEVHFSLSLESGNNEVIKFQGAVNGIVGSENVVCTTLGAGHPVSISWNTIIPLTLNDVLTVVGTAIDGAASIIITSSSVYIKEL